MAPPPLALSRRCKRRLSAIHRSIYRKEWWCSTRSTASRPISQRSGRALELQGGQRAAPAGGDQRHSPADVHDAHDDLPLEQRSRSRR